jgi:prefoldin subunit 5
MKEETMNKIIVYEIQSCRNNIRFYRQQIREMRQRLMSLEESRKLVDSDKEMLRKIKDSIDSF